MAADAAKDDLRTAVQRMRGRTAPTALQRASARAVDLLDRIPGLLRARTVLLHEPIPGDLDPRSLADRLGDRGVRVLVTPADRLEPTVVAPGRHRLAEATTGLDDMAAVEVVILPGVAFDLDGGRLGDEPDRWRPFLLRLSEDALRIGLARSTQLVPRVPRDLDDPVVDIVVTDHAVHHTGARVRPRDA